jgi:hypothetical protein
MQSKGRLKEEGIFRISGSVTRINALVEQLNDEATGGERRIDLDSHDVHTVGGAIKRTLIRIEPPLIPESLVSNMTKCVFLTIFSNKFCVFYFPKLNETFDHLFQFDGLHKAQFDGSPVPERLEKFRSLIGNIPKGRLEVLRHVFTFLRAVVAEHKHNRYGSCSRDICVSHQ